MDIKNIIYDWLIGLEHYETFKTLMVNIKCPWSPVLQMRKHNNYILYLYFRNSLIYQETKFNWADSYYINTLCGFGPDTHLLEHNNE